MTKRKRAAAMMLACLAFLIFCGVPFQQAHAVAAIDDAVILIIIASLAAMGITFEMTGGIRTVISWLSDVIDESGINFSNVRYGANSQGQILLNNRFLTQLSSLALYIQYELGLTDNSSVVISSPGTVAGAVYAYRLPLTVTSNDGTRYVMISTNPDAYVFFNFSNAAKTHVRPIAFSYGENSFQYIKYSSFGDSTYTLNSNQVNGGNFVWDQNYINIDGGSTSYSNDFTGIVIHDYSLASSTVGSWLMDNVFGTGIQNTNGLTAVGGAIDIPSGADIDGMGGILTLPVDWGDTLGQIINGIPGLVLEDELTGNTTLEIDEEADVADQISSEATNAEVISANPDDYSVSGLSEVFPFCIPFDLYDFLECLAAEPEAPSVTWRFYVPRICDETIEIDLSEFDAAAQVLRTMELLLFCVGLAFVTRHLLRG